MRLNAQTDYSLRVLMLLAAADPEPMTIQRVAAALKLSQAHLMRICAKLSAAGFLRTTRGRGGGLRLGRDSMAITIGEIVQCIESDFRLVECFDVADSGCNLVRSCTLKNALDSALKAFFCHLDGVTIGHLVQSNRADLLTLVGPEARTGPIPMLASGVNRN